MVILMRACYSCGFRRYVGDEKNICTHADIQLKLAARGIVQMRPSGFPQICPGSGEFDPAKQGHVLAESLERCVPASALVRSSPKKDKQLSFL